MSNRYSKHSHSGQISGILQAYGIHLSAEQRELLHLLKRTIEDSVKKGIHVGLYLEAGSWITEDQGAKPGFGGHKTHNSAPISTVSQDYTLLSARAEDNLR